MSEVTTELERRWVLPAIPDFPARTKPHFTTIWQYYVPIGDLVARLRRSRDLITESKRYQLAFKQGAGLARLEWEADIAEWMYRSWREQSIGNLYKTRIKVQMPDTRIPLAMTFDLFTSENLKGLFMLEVEHTHRSFPGNPTCVNTAKIILNQFELPSWVGQAREVTEDPRYNNQSLAINGRPE